jgi:hypothetical protein
MVKYQGEDRDRPAAKNGIYSKKNFKNLSFNLQLAQSFDRLITACRRAVNRQQIIN